ncbi:uncharacterized protein LOC111900247 isoform X1 [Lactuca sativa]|uniref:uncharacterized protein LOC111900247 isoform X1 n=1 Tax=Lactuca sativa TaxID=4236 RepID=UPI000CBADE9A|nr:uncharacterized protein LOC111900247 isoform X1 [Lactuca sativa]XP_042755202.1 uncharacterized protein LOC111900247 isoform X1 [Lactuca sativa]
MLHKNSSKKDRTPAYPLRRSPRFLQVVLVDPEDPRTPKPEPRRTRIPSSATPLNFTEKVKISSRGRSLGSKSEGCSQKHRESRNARKKSDNSKTRSTRSTRLTPCAEERTEEKSSRSSKRRNREFKRRVTRSSSHGDVDTNVKKTSYGGFTGNTGNDCLLTQVDTNTSRRCKSTLLKKKVKNSKKKWENNSDRFQTLAFDDNPNEGALLLPITENPTLDEELPKKSIAKLANQNEVAITTPSISHDEQQPMNKKDTIKKNQKNIGVKRKRNQHEGNSGISHGWTKDQESALERAYLQAKPTPHFWKKVSKLVPGKSAQECFDKVHGSHLTPPPPRLRSRARLPNSQDPVLSASKFLSSSSPTTKKPKSYKQKSHVIQRNVRHMLQNQYNKGEQDSSEADLFSVLEPTFTESLTSLTTPVRHLDMDVAFKRSSSTAHYKKSLSRFSGGSSATLVSPPVLKQVKNKALHEKYIDQLHCREASRKVASKKAEKYSSRSEGVKGGSSEKRKDAIKVAKNALVFGARDAINEFEFKQGMALIDIFEDECIVGDDDDDDDDGGQV